MKLTNRSTPSATIWGGAPATMWQWVRLIILPYKWWSVLILTICMIVSVPLAWSKVSLQLNALVQRNADTLLYLSVETLAEAGPDFESASQDHARMVSHCSEYMENSSFYTLFHRKLAGHAPSEQLPLIVESLQGTADGTAEPLKRIHEAGLSLEQFYLAAYKFLRAPKNYEAVLRGPSESAMAGVSDQLVEFASALEALEATRTFASAEMACRKSRVAGLYLYTAWPEYLEYSDPGKIDEFVKNLEDAHNWTVSVRNDTRDRAERDALCAYTHSLGRRLFVFGLMRDGKIEEARKYLRQALKDKDALKGDCGDE